MTVRRRDARLVFGAVALAYVVVYLWAIGDLARGLGGYEVFVVADPLHQFFRPSLGPLTFTAIARVELGPVTYLFSLNSLLGLGIGVLVGLNLALTYLAWTQPKACGIAKSSTGILAGVPALLSGTACCGPVVLIVFGIQASSLLLTTFQYLLPVAVLMLVGSLVLVGKQITPTPA